jgi:hypothetical protein
VTGEDWRRPDLWARYAGHFSPYLERRIKALKRRRFGRERGLVALGTEATRNTP